MSYSSGMLNKRIIIQNRTKAKTSEFGLDGNGIEWEDAQWVWASVTWSKGATALNAGAIDAYAVKLVRMRWTDVLTIRSRVIYDGQVYRILPDSFNADKQANTIQFLMQSTIEEDKEL